MTQTSIDFILLRVAEAMPEIIEALLAKAKQGDPEAAALVLGILAQSHPPGGEEYAPENRTYCH